MEPSYRRAFSLPSSSWLTNQPSEAIWPELHRLICGSEAERLRFGRDLFEDGLALKTAVGAGQPCDRHIVRARHGARALGDTGFIDADIIVRPPIVDETDTGVVCRCDIVDRRQDIGAQGKPRS